MVTNKDPGRGHFVVSLFKSAVRMMAGFAIIAGGVNLKSVEIIVGGVAIFVAEVLGVVEETV